MNSKSIYFLLLSTFISASANQIRINSDDECWVNNKPGISVKTDGALVTFSNKIAYGRANCSMDLTNSWAIESQNGFAIFLPRSLDCGSSVTVQCLATISNEDQNFPQPRTWQCLDKKARVEMPCSSIRLTYKRNLAVDDTKRSTEIQVVGLLKGPCLQNSGLFSCPRDYPDSCINANFRCNDGKECPSGDDERMCSQSESDGMSIFFVILLIIGILFLICVGLIVAICSCCGVAVNRFVRAVRPGKRNQNIPKETDVTIHGEDAGLMKELESKSPPVVDPPTYRSEPAAIFIDSTKPIYPRLE